MLVKQTPDLTNDTEAKQKQTLNNWKHSRKSYVLRRKEENNLTCNLLKISQTERELLLLVCLAAVLSPTH